MGCTIIPYTLPDGSYNPLGGYCQEDVGGLPTIGGLPAVNTGQGTNWAPLAPYISPPPYQPPILKPAYPDTPSASGPGAATAFTGVPVGAGTQQALVNPLSPVNQTLPGAATMGASLNVCDYLPSETAKAICRGLTGGGTPAQPKPTGTFTTPGTTCPPGYHAEAGKGCIQDGISQYLPGDVGRPDQVWQPINGRFGQGVRPMLVQAQRRACPAGMVLGRDGICYERLARTNRAHNPGTKPLLTGGDMNALRKAKALEKRWRKVAPAFHKKVVAAGARLVKTPKRK